MENLMWSVARILLAVAVLLPLVLYLLQDRLLFFPRPLDEQVRAAVTKARRDVEEVRIATPDHVTLHGWFVKNSPAPRNPLLIYFGGNAEEVSGNILDAGQLPGMSMLFVNFRGYGRSSGEPGEAAFFRDALTLYDYAAARADVDATRIVVMGRSLGSGVAVYLASQRPVAAAILVSPYDSITAVAQRQYPLVPVSWLLRHPFDSYSRAAGIKSPMLALTGEDDTLIPPEHARRLAGNWGGSAAVVMLAHADHNNISLHERYWPAITEFLKLYGVP